MTPEQESGLLGGGDTSLHSHPHMVTVDQFHRMQELEKVVSVSSSYSVNKSDDIILVTTTSGVVTLTLPRAAGGHHLTVVRVAGANNVTLTPQAGETINGSASLNITSSYTPLELKAFKGLGFIGV